MNNTALSKSVDALGNSFSNNVRTLVQLSLDALNEMYIPEKKVFYEKKKLIDGKIVYTGESIRYTLINLLGLHKALQYGLTIDFELNEILDYHIENIQKIKSIGDIGLLLWNCSRIAPEKITKILPKINFASILTDYPDAQKGFTNELAWLLIGLISASTFNSSFTSVINKLPHEVYKILRNNYGGHGIFSHSTIRGLKTFSRSRVGSFADQIYPIYAFTMYSKSFQNEEALMVAKECGETIVKHQGEQGQWWWHYDSLTGKILSKYPVYSVHQDSMAKLALSMLGKAINRNFSEEILKGARWMDGDNSMNKTMFDLENRMIYRRISPLKVNRISNIIFSLLGKEKLPKKNSLRTLYETWSYHYGWILFAHSNVMKKNNKIEGKSKKTSNKEDKHNPTIFSIND
ncbi:hypothetical protein BMS3Abin04_00148 [bacterium BMS3Abin04]|nr:hypothetical protein BMS3Abin04_00148 [bacterium BMS3Abin04]